MYLNYKDVIFIMK